VTQINKTITDNEINLILEKLQNKPIVLIGMMGAGKTSLGRRLATRLNRNFIDSDAEIEAASGMEIVDFFKTHGEKEFRIGEKKVIERLLKQKDTVIGTGGGAYINQETRALIKKKSLCIWIDANFDILFERISRRPTRPLMQTKNPKQTLKQLIDERYPIYKQADLTVVSKDDPHEFVINQILLAIKQYLET